MIGGTDGVEDQKIWTKKEHAEEEEDEKSVKEV